MMHSKHFLIAFMVMLFSCSLRAETELAAAPTPKQERATLTAGAGIGAALVSLLCVIGVVGTAINGLSYMEKKDASKCFLCANFTALLAYTAMQTAQVSFEKLKSLVSAKDEA